MSDQAFRELERRAATGDPAALEALAHAHVRLGRGWRGERLVARVTPGPRRDTYAWHAGTPLEVPLAGEPAGYAWLRAGAAIHLLAVADELVASLASPPELHGEAPREVEALIDELLRRGTRWVVVDARPLRIVTAEAVEVALRQGTRLRAAGGGLPIVGLPGPWRTPFDLLNLGHVLDLVGSREEALALVAGRRTSHAGWRPPPAVAPWLEAFTARHGLGGAT